MHGSTSLLSSLLMGALVIAAPLHAQDGEREREQQRALWQQHSSDFDYLLGDWEFDATSRDYGDFHGRWSAIRLAEGQVLDEYRIIGENGQTVYVTTTLRAYNALLDRWELVGMDAGNGLLDMGTARRVGNEMHIEQRFGVLTADSSLWRIRYYDIRADGFSWTADRSRDGGLTWEQGHLRIQTRRTGPPRRVDSLTGI